MNTFYHNLDDLVYDFIARYIAERGISPNMREIAAGSGFSSTSTASRYVDELEASGRIRRIPRIARGIVLVKQEAGQ